MRNKRFWALIVAMLALLVSAGQVFALSTSSPYHVSAYVPGTTTSWERYAANTTMYSVFPDYYYVNPSGIYDRVFNSNCFYFARLVTNKTKHVDFNLQTDGMRGIYLYGGHVKGVDELAGRSVSEIARLLYQHLNNAKGYPTVQQVRDAFSNVKPGDVVQFRGWSSQNQHTMVIASVSSSGFETLEGNNPYNTVRNYSYTFSQFRDRIAAAGRVGGFSIYRFGLDSTPPVINKCNPNQAIAGVYYEYQIDAEDASSWSTSPGTITSGWESYSKSAFVPGLSINSSGKISGTPEHTTQGKNMYWPMRYYFNVMATNSGGTTSKPAMIPVWEPPVITTDSTLPSGRVGIRYSQTLTAEGTEWTMDWRLKSGRLPTGVALSWSHSKRTATISGVPTKGGVYDFTIEVENLVGNPETTTEKKFRLIIYPLQEYEDNDMSINGSFPNGEKGKWYSKYLLASGNSLITVSRIVAEGSSVSVVKGTLPYGLSLVLSGRYIYLKGTPTLAGIYTFTIRLTHSGGGYVEKALTVTITNPYSDPWRDYSMSTVYNYLSGKYGVSYRDYILVRGGTSPYKAELISGKLPSGTDIETVGNKVYVYGKPSEYGTFSFTLRITGEHKGYVDKVCSLYIASNSSYLRYGGDADEEDEEEPKKPKIVTSKLPKAYIGSEYAATLEASGARPLTWIIDEDSSLPDGFTLSEAGELSGIPSEVGKYKFKVTVINDVDSHSKKYTLTILPEKPSILTESLPDGVVGDEYNFKLEADGTEPIKWTKSGKMPKGLTLDKTTGEISGTPTAAGTYTFKVKAKNKAGKDTVSFQIVIKDEATEDTIDNTSVIRSAAVQQDEAVNVTELYFLNGDEELDDDVIAAEAGEPLTFRIGGPNDELEADMSGLKVFVNDEEAEGVAVSREGTFTIPGEMVSGRFTVYAAGAAGGAEVETSELEVEAASESDEAASALQEESSGACSVNLAGMLMLAMSAVILLKK